MKYRTAYVCRFGMIVLAFIMCVGSPDIIDGIVHILMKQ